MLVILVGFSFMPYCSEWMFSVHCDGDAGLCVQDGRAWGAEEDLPGGGGEGRAAAGGMEKREHFIIKLFIPDEI